MTGHSYPFGLTMAAISSKALAFGEPKNKFKFNGYVENNSFDLNFYETFYRSHDPQIGRFWQLDPKPSDSVSLYAFGYNNPIRYFDPLGDTAILGLNKKSAGGFGHQVLIGQDKNQNWYVYSMGAAADERGLDLISGRTAEGEVAIVPLTPKQFEGLPEGKLSTNDIISFLKDNKLGDDKLSFSIPIYTTKEQDATIAKNAEQSKEDFASGKEEYNIYTNNSTHVTMRVLNTNTGLNLPTGWDPTWTHIRVVIEVVKRNEEAKKAN